MSRDPRYDILFEPVRIGPVTAPNRFYQTPHAIGMGWQRPKASAALRGIKAEGGWGVVSTEYCSIHPSSDDMPFGYLSIWDADDVAALAATADAIHEHGSLAAIELWHGGAHAANRMTREPLLGPSARPARYHMPSSVRQMDKADIKAFRGWQRDAATRAVEAGYDIVYVYAGHDYLPFQFLSPRHNDRTDTYGGSLENRVRLLREMIEDTREAVAGKAAVAIRLAVDELHGPLGITSEEEGREAVALLAELPDLWDVNVAGSLGNDSRSARFSEEGFQEDRIAFVKALTSKPVVSVGRFTSPDKMVSQIRRGIQDFIGAARPSIADPFLPAKIRDGRIDEIRECIGCNICRSANNEAVHIRCTQNPTIGEEWRRGWHPDKIAPRHADEHVLVVGGGPAGLEAALAAAQRGYRVTLAEAGSELGGRINRESRLPGLATWRRVRDYREGLLVRMANVEIYLESRLTADDILAFGADHVALATGSRWRRDGIGAQIEDPVDLAGVLTPDDLFAGAVPTGPVVIFDDEHYAMGGALAEWLAGLGHSVTLLTPAAMASSWTVMTDEQAFIQTRLIKAGVGIVALRQALNWQDGVLETACVYTGKTAAIACGTLVMVTGRIADDSLYHDLAALDWQSAGIKSLRRIGDCLVPSMIADAVYSGHAFARLLGEADTSPLLKRERPDPGGRHGRDQ